MGRRFVVAEQITPSQFEAISMLARLRTGPQKEAARLHLVEGYNRKEAILKANCHPSGLLRTLQAVRRAQTLAAMVVCKSPSQGVLRLKAPGAVIQASAN